MAPVLSPPRPAEVAALAAALRPGLLRVSRRLRQEAQKAGVSAQDALLLAHVSNTPGLGVSALADIEQTSRPTMSEHVKRLEAAGLVQRTQDAEDARRSGLALTPKGAKTLAAIRAQRNDWLAARLARLTPAEREALAAAAEPLLRLVAEDS